MSEDAAALHPVRRSALIAELWDLHQPPTYLATAISTAARKTTDNLRIVLFSPLFDAQSTPARARTADPSRPSRRDDNAFSYTGHFDEVQRLLTYVYVQATSVAQELGRVLVDIDVLLKGTQEPSPEELVRDAERVYCVAAQAPESSLIPASLQGRTGTIVLQPGKRPHVSPGLPSPPPPPPPPPPSGALPLPPLFRVAALGGTFDHLHAGHKILLSMGAWVAREKLIVGITDDALLRKKAHREVLENVALRTARTRAFLERFKPGLHYDIVPISDVYGPTAWDPDVQALIVSKETLSGAASIHRLRQEKSLPPLHTFVIDVISATEASVDDKDAEMLKNTKMSSTFIRRWIVQNQTRVESK